VFRPVHDPIVFAKVSRGRHCAKSNPLFNVSMGGGPVAPWSIEELEIAFAIKDRAGRSPMSISRTSQGGDQRPKLLTRGAARRIAVNFAKLLELLR
jgi:hypothetical protein